MVTAAKAKTGGAVAAAPVGSTLPTSAAATLDTAFVNLGYITEDGMTRAFDMNTDVIKAWGGDTVMVLDNGKTETFQFAMIDVDNIQTLKLFYGDDNITGTALSGGITIKSNNTTEKAGHAFVVDMIERGNTLHRIVIPNGVVTDVGDVVYVDNEPIKYDVTITAIADSSGNTAYEYMKTAET